MSDELEQQIADMLADGRMTDDDAEKVREFADFLNHAGSPVVKDKPSPDGKNVLDRLIEAGRPDLIEYALGPHNAEVAFWGHKGLDMVNVVGEPPYEVGPVSSAILRNVDPLRLLDLGCGQGRLTNYIAARIGEQGFVHGVDISRRLLDAAAIAAERNAKFWHGDGRTLPPGLSGKFTGAYSIAMFQHIPADAMWGYLREVHDRLEPGGTFLFTVAVGGIDEFLNHQIADLGAFASDLTQIYYQVTTHGTAENGWTWVTATKEP